jgi:lipopolysaccharide transport protein LptA
MKRWAIGLICALGLAALGAAPPQAKDEQRIQISADGPLDLDYGKRTGSATQNVRLTTEDGTIAADKMDFAFDENSNIVSLTATGKVRIQVKALTKKKEQLEIDARGDAATYEQKDRLLTLKGNVTGQIVVPARQQTIDLTSEMAQIWLDESRVTLQPARVTITQPKETPEPAPAKQ